MNLIEGLQAEMNRNRELLKCYQEIPTGALGAAMIKSDIEAAEQAIATGDTIKMMTVYESLKNNE